MTLNRRFGFHGGADGHRSQDRGRVRRTYQRLLRVYLADSRYRVGIAEIVLHGTTGTRIEPFAAVVLILDWRAEHRGDRRCS